MGEGKQASQQVSGWSKFCCPGTGEAGKQARERASEQTVSDFLSTGEMGRARERASKIFCQGGGGKQATK